MGAKKIYAEPMTITGSIGVVFGKFVTAGLWDKVGIKTEVLKRGANAGILSGESMFSPSEKARAKALLVDVYDQFVDKAHKARIRAGKKMTRDELEKLARGRIWTGRAAKENGLIDELGSLQDAVAGAWKMAGMKADKEPELLYLPKSKGFLDQLLDSSDTRMGAVERRLLKGLPGLAEKLRPAGALLQMKSEPVLAIVPFHIEVK
jgi:protease-4